MSADLRARAEAPDDTERALHAGVSFEEAYRLHAPAVARWAGALLGPVGRDEIEDVVHDVFVVVQRQLQGFRGESRVTTWLYGITARVVSDRRKKWRLRRRLFGWRRELSVRDDAADAIDRLPGGPSPEESLARKRELETLFQVLDQIGERYRNVVVLYDLQGLSGPEIASLTGMSLSNVWTSVARGRQLLAERWQKLQRKGRLR